MSLDLPPTYDNGTFLSPGVALRAENAEKRCAQRSRACDSSAFSSEGPPLTDQARELASGQRAANFDGYRGMLGLTCLGLVAR
jgi:hypothetical protein